MIHIPNEWESTNRLSEDHLLIISISSSSPALLDMFTIESKHLLAANDSCKEWMPRKKVTFPTVGKVMGKIPIPVC